MHKTPYVFPVLGTFLAHISSCHPLLTSLDDEGGRKIEHLKANIKALDIALTGDQIKRLEGVLPFDLGFPGNMVVCVQSTFYIHTFPILTRGGDGIQQGVGSSVSGILQGQAASNLDVWPLPGVIKPMAQ